ncbi:hypothetical protein [Streptomyces sp. NPDC058579]|uniref:hypothetical protein n=1 Tax=Streptomyces sp. NPDC058579 TaxID=3346548 RepID=UPI0036689192
MHDFAANEPAVHAYRRAALAAVLLLTLGACGIQGTDVVESGDAASVVVQPPPALRMTLFLVGGDGRLAPVVRDGQGIDHGPDPGPTPTGTGAADSADLRETDVGQGRTGRPMKALVALLAGPDEGERAAGLGSRLPAGRHELYVSDYAAKMGTYGMPTYLVRSTGPVKALEPVAVQQIVCTTVFAKDPAGLAAISLSGPDGTLAAQTCGQ